MALAVVCLELIILLIICQQYRAQETFPYNLDGWEQLDKTIQDEAGRAEHLSKHAPNKPSLSRDTPLCGYGVRVCECQREAATCVLNLEIDEMMTFTSYEKFHTSISEGLAVRGARGVTYTIDRSTGIARPLTIDRPRACGDTWNPVDCTEPQYVDGKTYRMVLGVNGQVPGPTIIVHEDQEVIIHVHNNITEGISIHWHGMHQYGTPWMDGVGQVTQCQIGPSTSYSYKYTAKPSGTFWYHSHSAAQRTDGFFGALIVKEKLSHFDTVKKELAAYGVKPFLDLPQLHSITLIDWQQEESHVNFARANGFLWFYPNIPSGQVPNDCDDTYTTTVSMESSSVGPLPFFSGLINGKGRHSDVPYSKTRLSVFTVQKGQSYLFRLIGAQGLYAFKFSIDGHKLTLVATDGYWIQPVKNVDFIIIHSGERYDFILDANQEVKNYWMRAETLEINSNGVPPYQSLNHVAEGILQYVEPGQIAEEIPSTNYEDIKLRSKAVVCSAIEKCRAVNCPFESFHPFYHTECINAWELQLLEDTPTDELPDVYPSSDCPDCLHFMNFNFEGNSQTGSVNGRNFILPPAPPQTQKKDFENQAVKCDLETECDPDAPNLDCTCTHMIDIPYKKTVQLVLSSVGLFPGSHPIHLHGHSFHVVKVGYPPYNKETGFVERTSHYICDGSTQSVLEHNKDISCGDACTEGSCPPGEICKPNSCTKPQWTNYKSPELTINKRTIRKDTVIVPAGGYVVINFISDNPGTWFLHCHIEVHQLEGMAMIVNEAPRQQEEFVVPANLNKCGDFT